MNRRVFAAGFAAVVMTFSVGTAQSAAGTTELAPLAMAGADGVPGEYIVQLADGARPGVLAGSLDVATKHVYQATIKGFSAKLTDAQLAEVRAMDGVVAVSQNATVQVDQVSSWGLDRIDQANLPLDNQYNHTNSGAGVHAYIIDTGVDPAHPDFGGRASVAFDSLGGNGIDCHGHGTHVSGTVGGTTYGVAPEASLYGVRVLNCAGSGTWDSVIAGMDWVAANGQRPAVANMSLGGGFNASVNAAATALANSGVFTSIAAGNSSVDACNYSPAGADGVLTVAASDINDVSAWFTNHGSCVEVYGPGVAIKSAWLNGGTNTISGTSMAAPHVAGVGALYKGTNGDVDTATLNAWIQDNSSKGVISGAPAGTPPDVVQTAGL